MAEPKVSIIIPTFDSASFLQTTLDSALSQDFDDYEIVVVDDGSKDETPNILRKYKSPRLHVYFEDHVGCAANYNRCLERASGEYIAILDHDDIMKPDRIRKQAAFLDSNLGVYLVGSNYEVIDDHGDVTERRPMPTGSENVARFEMVFNAVQHPTAMYRKRLVDLIGVYDETYFPSHDSHFILRAILKTAADNIPEALTQWRRMPDSPTNILSPEQSRLHYKIRKEANAAKYHAYPVANQKQKFALNLCKIAYYYGDGKEARYWALKALRHGLMTKELFRYLSSSTVMPFVRWLRKRGIILPFLKQQKEQSADWTYYSP
jgi:glycosyltransferase involved in cell wall biosynthesis